MQARYRKSDSNQFASKESAVRTELGPVSVALSRKNVCLARQNSGSGLWWSSRSS